MSDDQANLQKVLIFDGNDARAAAFGRCLQYLNYDAIIVGRDISPKDLDKGVELKNIAVVAGDLETRPEFADLASVYHADNCAVPFLCFGEATATRPELADGYSWHLDLPLRRSQLKRLLRRAERYQVQERRQRLTGSSPSIRGVRARIEQVADFDTNVLITGQSGTGKELVARTIHELSPRADRPFVPINCGAIPAELLESELFGHKKGAFTGAIADRSGRFELAEGGTLFLDEIGDMSLDMQVKLLRVLQERTFERVGSGTTQTCNVRIVAATHRDLPEAMAIGAFREDLFYRLNVFPIEMPPLYKRASDLPQLLNELFISCGDNSQDELRVTPDAVHMLAGYPWPGNIRELSNLVERLAITKPEGKIEVDDLPAKYRSANAAPAAVANTVSQAMRLTEANLKDHLQNVEQELIEQAMRASDGVVAQAARLLGMRRTTLVEKVGKYQIA